MTALVSEQQVLWLTLAMSAAGIGGLLIWIRRQGTVLWGGLALVAALTWPLWRLFEWIDRWLDTTSVIGMAAPYAIFAVIGWGAGTLAAAFKNRIG